MTIRISITNKRLENREDCLPLNLMTKVKIPPVITFNRTEEDRNHRDNFAYVSRVLFQSSASGGKTIDSFLKEVCL